MRALLAIVCIGESLEQANESARIAATIRASYSRPESTRTTRRRSIRVADIAELERLLDAGAVAVGECGLDYHYDNSPRDAQRRAFAMQIALAEAV